VHVVFLEVSRVRVCNWFDDDIVQCKSHSKGIEVRRYHACSVLYLNFIRVVGSARSKICDVVSSTVAASDDLIQRTALKYAHRLNLIHIK
jgi:hypothetical protein